MHVERMVVVAAIALSACGTAPRNQLDAGVDAGWPGWGPFDSGTEDASVTSDGGCGPQPTTCQCVGLSTFRPPYASTSRTCYETVLEAIDFACSHGRDPFVCNGEVRVHTQPTAPDPGLECKYRDGGLVGAGYFGDQGCLVAADWPYGCNPEGLVPCDLDAGRNACQPAETCGDWLDNDCNGHVDDGCPADAGP